MKTYQITIYFLVFMLTSCILEDRGKCPAYLTLDLSETPREVDSLYMVLQYQEGTTFTKTINKENFLDEYEIAIPRGEGYLAVYGNIDTSSYNNGYIVPFGCAADNIFTHFSQIDYNMDLIKEKIDVMKNNMGIIVKILGKSRDNSRIHIEIEGDKIGYSNDGRTLDGTFLHRPDNLHEPTNGEDYYMFKSRVTRHDSNSNLTLKVYSTGDNAPNKVKLIYETSIMEKLSAAGISMNDPSLKDICITVDQAVPSITIGIDQYEDMEHTELEF
jgi:hypothetical protein